VGVAEAKSAELIKEAEEKAAAILSAANANAAKVNEVRAAAEHELAVLTQKLQSAKAERARLLKEAIT
jgi:hypothetical protein